VKTARALTLARRNLASNPRGAALSALGVAIGVACLVFFTALGRGVTTVVRTRVLPVDESALEVKLPEVSLGSFLGGGKLDDEALARLKALDGVQDVYPKMEVRVPSSSRFNGDFFGRSLRMYVEVVANGVDPRLVEKDVAPGKQFRDGGPGSVIPVLANAGLLEIYNKTFAPSRGLPTLSPELLTGFHIPVDWGKSFISPSNGPSSEGQLEIVGFSTFALPLGVTMPLDTARRLNRELGRDATTYSSAVLRAATPDAMPRLAAEVRRMGFDVDDAQQKRAEQVGFGIAVVTGALSLLSLLITLLAAVNIAHAFYAAVRERRREIGVLRAVGASQRDVMLVLLLEAALVGLVGGCVGLLGGWLATVGADLLAAKAIPDFPFKPDTFFAFSPAIVFGSLGVALLASLGGAYPPARGAAMSEPAQALSE
jgi:putative ABC transport system permease protein